jgi:hypothetical protein
MISPRILKRTGKKVYDVRLRDPNGKEYCRTFASKQAAKDFEADEKGDRRHGTWIDPRHASKVLGSVAEDWLAADGTKRASSIARDRSALDNHVLPVDHFACPFECRAHVLGDAGPVRLCRGLRPDRAYPLP